MDLGETTYFVHPAWSGDFPEQDKPILENISPLCESMNNLGGPSPINRRITFVGTTEGSNIYYVSDMENFELGPNGIGPAVCGHGRSEIHIKKMEIVYRHDDP